MYIHFSQKQQIVMNCFNSVNNFYYTFNTQIWLRKKFYQAENRKYWVEGGGGDIALNVENIGLKNKIESSNVIFKRNYILNLIVYICPIQS